MPDADYLHESSDRLVVGGRAPGDGTTGLTDESDCRRVIGKRRSSPESAREIAPASLLERVTSEPQKAFPAIAKDPEACGQLERAIRSLPTSHVICNMDSRQIDIEPESVGLVVTSPPY